jgi:hypothetical protein
MCYYLLVTNESRGWAASSMVEQVTLNHWVQGSSPWLLTKTKSLLSITPDAEKAFCFNARSDFWVALVFLLATILRSAWGTIG